MGFNDPFSREHWGILLRTIDWQDYRLDAHASGSLVFWILAGMHVAAAGWILCADSRRLRAPMVFLGAQVLMFPGSIVGVLVLPHYLVAAVRGEFDREGIVDGPLFTWAGQAVWLLTCLASVLMIFIHQRRTAWRRLKEASRIPREA